MNVQTPTVDMVTTSAFTVDAAPSTPESTLSDPLLTIQNDTGDMVRILVKMPYQKTLQPGEGFSRHIGIAPASVEVQDYEILTQEIAGEIEELLTMGSYLIEVEGRGRKTFAHLADERRSLFSVLIREQQDDTFAPAPLRHKTDVQAEDVRFSEDHHEYTLSQQSAQSLQHSLHAYLASH